MQVQYWHSNLPPEIHLCHHPLFAICELPFRSSKVPNQKSSWIQSMKSEVPNLKYLNFRTVIKIPLHTDLHKWLPNQSLLLTDPIQSSTAQPILFSQFAQCSDEKESRRWDIVKSWYRLKSLCSIVWLTWLFTITVREKFDLKSAPICNFLMSVEETLTTMSRC